MAQDTKVALITGANKGIGLETARQLGQQGIVVIAAARDFNKSEHAAKVLRGEGIDARSLKLDVTSAQDRDAAVKFVQQHFGKLDILVNNAGIMVEGEWAANDSDSISLETLQQTFDTNFFGPIALTQALLPLLKKAPAARIVNLSSIQGSLAIHSDPKSPIYGLKPFGYNSSKTALNSFTVHLAHALRDTPIKVNSAHPGWVKTDMGTDAAPLNVAEGAKTTVELATLPKDGPTGAYLHAGKVLPW
ncbi:MAG TPA: SDR family oxidoreductase [Acidobacteriaceae bacterium]|nr:SDR family oxidoreductase [Acidobacteriaceae bacterium]